MSGTDTAVTVTGDLPRRVLAGRRRRLWAVARVLAGAGILALLIWRLGTGPFVDGIRTIDAWSLGAAFVIGVLTTVCCAWRWHLVSRGLGVGVPLRAAVPAYYRSLFLNTTLPGGVLGDVHRAVRHGREAGDVGAGVRAVAWERSAGQVVQVALTVVVLLLLPSPVRGAMPLVALGVAAVAVLAILVSRTLPRSGPALWVRAMQTAGSDLRHGLLAQRAWPGIVLASALVVAGHAATFLIAARTVGLSASTVHLLPIALIVLMAMAIPLSIGGWGPREGVAAWVFAMAGLGAAQGVATAVVYGVLSLVATLPGAVVLAVSWRRRDAVTARPAAHA
ncbi:MAG: flippase-like domain-containing protein [Actinobacteria bacterium]|nr:flippase-like domain-containing protein [Actinomycetota bacterium]